MAYELIRLNQKVLIIDYPNPSSSTRIAAGIILPVTGRRMVKTWKADEAIPVAFEKYSELEKILVKKLFYSKSLIEIFSSVKNANDWKIRSAEKDVKNYIGKIYAAGEIPEINAPFGAIELLESGYLDTSTFLNSFSVFFKNKECIVYEKLEAKEVNFKNGIVTWKNYEADKIIFCEGYSAAYNSVIPSLPWQLSKGEMLLIHCQELPEDFIYNHGVFICPAGDHLFKVGSTYEWNDLDEHVTQKAQLKLRESLDKMLKVPYTIEKQIAAIRPTVKERRPFIGLFQDNRLSGIFNGLGTKGVLLAPYYAIQFTNHLVNGLGLDTEVNVNRFS